MADYRIEIKRSAEKESANLEPATAGRILDAIRELAKAPRPRGTVKLSGEMEGYGVRVGSYRVLDEIDDKRREVSIREVSHRRESYRRR